jgi:NAD(P)-dependent dehydrogenase (short-subunit alcohol dehydrogenase family)
MNIDLSGKTAIITGSTAGIGLAIAKGLATAGAKVIVNGRTEGAVAKAVMIHYGMTKTAMLALSRGLAKRAAGTGVTVNSILPGPTLSEGVAEMLKKEMAATGRSLDEVAAAFVAAQRPSSIIRRPASAKEVANMVVYAASPQASATTGAALRVDGGVVDTIA